MEKVALLKCDQYDVDVIEQKLREGFSLLGGDTFLKKLIPSGSTLLLKPNMLVAEPKGSIVITHHAVFEAAIRIFKEYTPHIIFGDSPGVGDSRKAAEKAGFLEVAKKYDVTFVDFKEAIDVSLSDSLLCRSWHVAKAPYEADVVITLPRMKTHGMAYFTGAIKNQFGCIPGTEKATWHTRMPEAAHFCKMLLDLNTLVHTDFAILDGIVAMQGNGPKNGTPYPMNTLIMGSSLSAVDSVAVQLIGYPDPLTIPVLKEAYDSNWGVVLPKDIEVLGESIDTLKVNDFELCRQAGNFYFLNPQVTAFLTGLLAPSPSLVNPNCVGCNRCYEVCPETPKAITMVAGPKTNIPKWDMKKCIHCFCCQELCPVGAIGIKKTPIGKLLSRL